MPLQNGRYRFVVALAALVASSAPAIAQQGWRTRNFPPPNGGLLVFTIIRGNPACASYDGRNCLWGRKMSQIDFGRVRPLICGANHRAVWGVTGYENPQHWCSLAKPQAKPQTFD